MALAWVKDRWLVAANIIGATTMEQLKEDIAAAATMLPRRCNRRNRAYSLRPS